MKETLLVVTLLCFYIISTYQKAQKLTIPNDPEV